MDKNLFLAETLELTFQSFSSARTVPAFDKGDDFFKLILAGRRKLAEMWHTNVDRIELKLVETAVGNHTAELEAWEVRVDGTRYTRKKFVAQSRGSIPEAVRDVFFVALGGKE